MVLGLVFILPLWRSGVEIEPYEEIVNDAEEFSVATATIPQSSLSFLQITQWSGGQFSPSVRTHNPATRFQLPSATVVSAEPFSHRTGTLRCLQKEMATYRH